MDIQKDLFHLLIRNSCDLIILIKDDGIIFYQSPSFKLLLGYESEELTGMNLFDLAHPDDSAAVKKAVAETSRNPDLPLSLRFRFRHKNGSWRRLESRGSNQLMNSAIAGIVIYSLDVTERQTNDNLREKDELPQRIFELAPFGIIIAGTDMKILKANQTLCTLLGYAADELPGLSIDEILASPGENEKRGYFTERILKGELIQTERQCVKKTGGAVRLNIAAAPIRRGNRTLFVVLGIIENKSRHPVEQKREKLIPQLQQVFDKIKTQRGLLPMCAWCKKIRNNEGHWQKVETFIQEHSEVLFTHGICPDCFKKVDPEAFSKVFEADKEVSIKERRRIERKRPFIDAISYRVRSRGKIETKALDAVIQDISISGMCIRTQYPLEDHSMVLFSDGMHDKGGIVRWRENAGNDNMCRVGIEFI